MARILCFLLLLSVGSFSIASAQIDGAMRKNLLASASTDGGIYMIILDQDGRRVPGTLNEKEKPGYIPVTSFTQLSESAGDGSPVQLGQVKISKSVGESSAVFLEALSEGEKLKQVDILVYNTSGEGKESEEFRLRLDKVKVISVNTRIKAGNPRLPNSTLVEEDVVLDFESITWLFNDGTSSFRAERP